MKLIERVIKNGVVLSEEVRTFLTALSETQPTRTERLIVAHLQTVGTWAPWEPATLSSETGVPLKDLEDALSKLVQNGAVQMYAKSETANPSNPFGLQPRINESFGTGR